MNSLNGRGAEACPSVEAPLPPNDPPKGREPPLLIGVFITPDASALARSLDCEVLPPEACTDDVVSRPAELGVAMTIARSPLNTNRCTSYLDEMARYR